MISDGQDLDDWGTDTRSRCTCNPLKGLKRTMDQLYRTLAFRDPKEWFQLPPWEITAAATRDTSTKVWLLHCFILADILPRHDQIPTLLYLAYSGGTLPNQGSQVGWKKKKSDKKSRFRIWSAVIRNKSLQVSWNDDDELKTLNWKQAKPGQVVQQERHFHVQHDVEGAKLSLPNAFLQYRNTMRTKLHPY
jgi:hypothetical protein